jgi:hypothetical protein
MASASERALKNYPADGDPTRDLRHRLLELSTRRLGENRQHFRAFDPGRLCHGRSGKTYAFAILPNGGGLGEYGAHAYQTGGSEPRSRTGSWPPVLSGPVDLSSPDLKNKFP